MKRLIIAAFLLSGCAARDLNGEKYASQATYNAVEGSSGVMLPVGRDETKATIIVSGQVYRGAGLERGPLSGAIVKILDDGKIVAETRTKSSGEFDWRGLLAKKSYKIRVEHNGRTKEIPFRVSTTEVKDLNFNLE